VKKFDGTAWVDVGSPGFSGGVAYFTDLEFDGSTPYVVYQDVSNSYKATVMRFVVPQVDIPPAPPTPAPAPAPAPAPPAPAPISEPTPEPIVVPTPAPEPIETPKFGIFLADNYLDIRFPDCPSSIAADVMMQGDSDDFMMGDANSNVLCGNGGQDTVVGLEQADYLAGDDGDDWIFSNSGNDTVSGGEGEDIIFSGKDDDVVKRHLRKLGFCLDRIRV
jgi:hypothetical protein